MGLHESSAQNFQSFKVIPVIAWELRHNQAHQFTPERNFFRRIGANIIDYLLIALIIVPLYFQTDYLFFLIKGGRYSISPHFETYELVEFLSKSFVILASFTSYFYFFYRFKATTVGKKFFNLNTYRYNSHEPIGLIRVIAREIFFKAFAIAVFPTTIIHFLLQPEGLFIHDILTKSMVVKEIP